MTEPCWGGVGRGEKLTDRLSLHAEDSRLEALAGVGPGPDTSRKPGSDREQPRPRAPTPRGPSSGECALQL